MSGYGSIYRNYYDRRRPYLEAPDGWFPWYDPAYRQKPETEQKINRSRVRGLYIVENESSGHKNDDSVGPKMISTSTEAPDTFIPRYRAYRQKLETEDKIRSRARGLSIVENESSGHKNDDSVGPKMTSTSTEAPDTFFPRYRAYRQKPETEEKISSIRARGRSVVENESSGHKNDDSVRPKKTSTSTSGGAAASYSSHSGRKGKLHKQKYTQDAEASSDDE